MSKGEFATAINCMDGRAQLPVIAHLKAKYGVDFVDMITLPGACGVLASGDAAALAQARERAGISVGKHGSGVVAVCGHCDCAGNPVEASVQREQIKATMALMRGWGFPVKVVGLWMGESWEVEEIL